MLCAHSISSTCIPRVASYNMPLCALLTLIPLPLTRLVCVKYVCALCRESSCQTTKRNAENVDLAPSLFSFCLSLSLSFLSLLFKEKITIPRFYPRSVLPPLMPLLVSRIRKRSLSACSTSGRYAIECRFCGTTLVITRNKVEN